MIKKTLLCAAVSILASQAALAGDKGMDLNVSANADISSTYLLRGVDLGGPAMMGDVKVQHKSGVYGEVAIVSATEEEQNYEIGFSKMLGEYDINASYKSYTYPGKSGVDKEELALDINRDKVTLSLVQDQDTDDVYVAGTLKTGKLTSTVGVQAADDGYTHLQFDYQMTERLKLTASQAMDDGFGVEEDLRFVVGYSLPLM